MAKTKKPTTSRSAKTTGTRKTVAPTEDSEAAAQATPARSTTGGTRAKSKAAPRKSAKKPASNKTPKPDPVEPPLDPKPDAPDRVEPAKAAVRAATGATAVTSGDEDKAPAARANATPGQPKQPTAQAKTSGAPMSAKGAAKARARPRSAKDTPAGGAPAAAARSAAGASTRAPRQPRQGLPDPGFTSPYRRRLYQLHEWLWRGDGASCERLPTHGVVSLDDLTLPKTRLVEAYPDRPSPARLVDWTIDALPMRPERLTFIDLGSGRGRVLMEAAKHPFQEVIGVEVTRELHETALMNLRHWPRWRLACRNITLVNSDVGQYDLPRRNIALYLFRPFTDRLMMAVARKATAVARAGHDVFVIVVDPKHALPFNQSPIFEALTPSTSVRRRLRWQSPYSVAFYRANLS